MSTPDSERSEATSLLSVATLFVVPSTTSVTLLLAHTNPVMLASARNAAKKAATVYRVFRKRAGPAGSLKLDSLVSVQRLGDGTVSDSTRMRMLTQTRRSPRVDLGRSRAGPRTTPRDGVRAPQERCPRRRSTSATSC